jgi:hypothetical protein
MNLTYFLAREFVKIIAKFLPVLYGGSKYIRSTESFSFSLINPYYLQRTIIDLNVAVGVEFVIIVFSYWLFR